MWRLAPFHNPSQGFPDDLINTDTTRYVVKAFKTLATKAGEQLHQGDQVIVAGSIVTETWTDNDTNQKRYSQTVLADAIGTSL